MTSKIKTRIAAAVSGLALAGGLTVASAPDAQAYALSMQVFGSTKSVCQYRVSYEARTYDGPHTYVGYSGCHYRSALGKWTAVLWFD